MASVVGAGLLILAVPALIWQLQAPYPGFTLRSSADDRAVVKTVEAGGTAASLGVEPGDTLVSVGGMRPSEELPVDDRGPVFRLDLTNRFRESRSTGSYSGTAVAVRWSVRSRAFRIPGPSPGPSCWVSSG